MGFVKNLCEHCLNFMKVEKVGEGFVLKCPYCEELKSGVSEERGD